MSEYQNVNVDEITGGGEIVPPGNYNVRLIAVDGSKPSKNDKPLVTATFEIIDGDYDGLELKAFYTMFVGDANKAGRRFAPGLAEMKQVFAAVGSPLGAGSTLSADPQAAAKLYHSKVKGKTLSVRVIPEKQFKKNEDGDRVPVMVEYEDADGQIQTRQKVFNKTKILGIAGPATTGAGQDPLASL